MQKVTVLMAVHNGEKYLREAIESILNQTFRDFEFLIIDDASTDSSAKIIAEYQDDRIRVLRNDQNIGLTKSLNRGLREAAGEYIARMDADDVSFPRRLELQAKYLDENTDIALVGSLVQIVDDTGRVLSYQQINPHGPELVHLALLYKNIITHSSAMFRVGIARQLGGYDESFPYAQDYDLWLKIIREFGASLVNEVLVSWRESSGGISSMRRVEQQTCARNIFRKHIGQKVSIQTAWMKNSLEHCHEGQGPWFGLLDIYALWRCGKIVLTSSSLQLDSGKMKQAWYFLALKHVKRSALQYPLVIFLNKQRKKILRPAGKQHDI